MFVDIEKNLQTEELIAIKMHSLINEAFDHLIQSTSLSDVDIIHTVVSDTLKLLLVELLRQDKLVETL